MRDASPEIAFPSLSLVLLIGPSGSGKSTFARRHFKATEIVSSDTCRGIVSDDENDQSASADAFALLQYIVAKRLERGLLTVVDATNVRPEDRKEYVRLAREYHVLAVAIVLDLAPSVCVARNAERPDRDFGEHVVRNQSRALRQSLGSLKRGGFRHIHILSTPAAVEDATITRTRLWNDRRDDAGPFDIIGDVHGCYDELIQLLTELGYEVAADGSDAIPPAGRRALFLGDLVDRGPDSPAVLRLVMGMVAAGHALCVPGNHDSKLQRHLTGASVRPSHGLAETIAQLATQPATFRAEVATFIDNLVSHYVLDDGNLVVAHAGLKESLQGRASGAVRSFALYGETTGESDEYGLPIRADWAASYRGRAQVVYGHTPTLHPEWVNGTICIDTGCVFGGALTALRYPEREIVSVPAAREYYAPARPLAPPAAPQEVLRASDLLDVQDVLGKQVIETRITRSISIGAGNAAAALEAVSRFAIDPRWLIYLPPTMSPAEAQPDGEFLEHPDQTFAYFRQTDVSAVICQEKHMGSRAVVVLCRDEATASRRFFGVSGVGVIYTRTGRAFFPQEEQQTQALARLHAAMTASDLWDRLQTDWVCLDVEILPWSAKALSLLRSQFAATGAAAEAALQAATALLVSPASAGTDELRARLDARQQATTSYRDAYRRYCWDVDGLKGVQIAPFHLLASEGHVHTDRNHLWHMDTLAALCDADPTFLRKTAHLVVNLQDDSQTEAAVKWWTERTEAGAEGMVVKPLDWIVSGRGGLVQPAIKCRGREYLRIIYGPEYTLPENLPRLRARALRPKRSLALREFALGLEGLHRFVDHDPLYRVHACVFGVLALESEPVDPRL